MFFVFGGTLGIESLWCPGDTVVGLRIGAVGLLFDFEYIGVEVLIIDGFLAWCVDAEETFGNCLDTFPGHFGSLFLGGWWRWFVLL